VCAKDRHGNYRRGDAAALVDLAVYPDGAVSAQVWPPIATKEDPGLSGCALSPPGPYEPPRTPHDRSANATLMRS
jgi:hypothetical protein